MVSLFRTPLAPRISKPSVRRCSRSGSSSSAQQLTINLNQQSNYELILNLLNSTATGQTTSGSSSALNVQA
jgi:uncharacterized membrane protein